MDGYSVSITLDEAREIKKQENKEKGAPVYFQELVLYMGALRVVRAHERGDKLQNKDFIIYWTIFIFSREVSKK